MATLKESASGVAISSDNGKTWKTSNWNQTTGARYGIKSCRNITSITLLILLLRSFFH